VGGGNALIPAPGGGCRESAPPISAARRLTRDQYASTVRDLVGDMKNVAAAQLPDDAPADEAFADPGALIVSPDWAANAMNAAEAAARIAVANLPALLPCDPASGESCARQFITSFGKRAFRRPVTPAEMDGLLKIHALGASSGFSHGVELVVRAMLQAPSFLYRLELGQQMGSSPGLVQLTPHEVASRLSYLFWGTAPDETLMAEADAGKLATGDQIGAQARRLLADPRARATIAGFHGRWLGIDGLAQAAKDPQRYPQFDDRLTASMRTELQMFLDDLLKSDGRMESLFTAHFTYVDASLAPLYEVPAPAAGSFARVELDPTRRAGILTNAGLLSAHTFADESEPIHRGKFIRERLLCMTPPDPPAGLMVMPPTPAPGVSTRQRLIEHSAIPSCQSCHQLMDPIGFAFEAYDGIGRFRTRDGNGRPVDDNAQLMMTMDIDGPVKGPIELAQKLAGSRQVQACLTTTAVQYAQSRETGSDACLQSKLISAFDAARHDVRELFVAIARSDGFRYRQAIAGEVLP
jgi:hypothetical protein